MDKYDLIRQLQETEGDEVVLEGRVDAEFVEIGGVSKLDDGSIVIMAE